MSKGIDKIVSTSLESVPETDKCSELVHTTRICKPTMFSNKIFTLYSFTITNPTTKLWWTVRKRYSDFFRLRKEIATCVSKQTIAHGKEEYLYQLKRFLDLPFPKKCLSHDMPLVIYERTKAFQLHMQHLVNLYMSCANDVASKETLSMDTRTHFLIGAFLCIPKSISPQSTCREKDDCIICLSSLSNSIATLDCSHTFHRDCVFKWIEEKRSCPICRASTASCSGTVV